MLSLAAIVLALALMTVMVVRTPSAFLFDLIERSL